MRCQGLITIIEQKARQPVTTNISINKRKTEAHPCLERALSLPMVEPRVAHQHANLLVRANLTLLALVSLRQEQPDELSIVLTPRPLFAVLFWFFVFLLFVFHLRV